LHHALVIMKRARSSRSAGGVDATLHAPAMDDLSGTTAVILAGGLGTRLRPVVADRPKVLAEVDGVPFVFHLLAQLAAAGVEHVVLSTGWLGEQVRDAVGASWGSLEVEYAQEPAPLGTGGAIRRTLPLVRSQALFVLNGDSYCDVDLASLWLWHHQRAAHGTLALSHVDDARRYGTVVTDAYGRITHFAEKARQRRAGTVNAGLYLLSRSLVASIPAGTAYSLERDLLPRWLDLGIYGYARSERFIDIGTPESLAGAAGFFRKPGSRRTGAPRQRRNNRRTSAALTLTAEVA
jgi:NDP-sugar pyrophosphorylase family protein